MLRTNTQTMRSLFRLLSDLDWDLGMGSARGGFPPSFESHTRHQAMMDVRTSKVHDLCRHILLRWLHDMCFSLRKLFLQPGEHSDAPMNFLRASQSGSLARSIAYWRCHVFLRHGERCLGVQSQHQRNEQGRQKLSRYST